jgi:hypothetical protein
VYILAYYVGLDGVGKILLGKKHFLGKSMVKNTIKKSFFFVVVVV